MYKRNLSSSHLNDSYDMIKLIKLSNLWISYWRLYLQVNRLQLQIRLMKINVDQILPNLGVLIRRSMNRIIKVCIHDFYLKDYKTNTFDKLKSNKPIDSWLLSKYDFYQTPLKTPFLCLEYHYF